MERQAAGSADDRFTEGAIDEATWKELMLLPHADDWPETGERERQRRARVLWEVARRVLEEGPHQAIASPERGRQFKPFAALRGYEEMVDEVFKEAARDENACP